MDANNMRSLFLLQYEGGRLGNRTFNDREITDFLNKGQEVLIKRRYDSLKNRTRRGFVDSAIRQAELDGVISSSTRISNNLFIQGDHTNGALRTPDVDNTSELSQVTHNYGVFVALPDEAIYLLYESVNTADNISKLNIDDKELLDYNQEQPVTIKYNLPVEEITYSQYRESIYDPYKKPYDNLVWAISYGNFMPSVQAQGNVSNDKNNPSIVTVSNSTKVFTHTGTGYNFKGVTPATYNNIDEEKSWLAFKTNRTRYLIPGKNWYIMDYTCHYLAMPPLINVDVITPSLQRNCVLAPFLHREVVDEAVKLAAASIVPEQGKYQVATNEAALNE